MDSSPEQKKLVKMQQFTRAFKTEINIGPLKTIVFGSLAFLSRLPLAFVVGVVACYYSYQSSLFLLDIAKGATIRPMFEGAWTGLIVLAAIILGVPLALGEAYRAVRVGGLLRFTLAVIGLALCLSTWVVGNHFWEYYQGERGIHFEQ
jgi:hypothetical protein